MRKASRRLAGLQTLPGLTIILMLSCWSCIFIKNQRWWCWVISMISDLKHAQAIFWGIQGQLWLGIVSRNKRNKLSNEHAQFYKSEDREYTHIVQYNLFNWKDAKDACQSVLQSLEIISLSHIRFRYILTVQIICFSNLQSAKNKDKWIDFLSTK